MSSSASAEEIWIKSNVHWNLITPVFIAYIDESSVLPAMSVHKAKLQQTATPRLQTASSRAPPGVVERNPVGLTSYAWIAVVVSHSIG